MPEQLFDKRLDDNIGNNTCNVVEDHSLNLSSEINCPAKEKH